MTTEEIYKFLENYKVNTLKIKENGIFRKKEYGHILPLKYGKLNYLCDDARKCAEKIKKHMYWYHLNSSQTMCINFFVYILKNKGLLNKLIKLITGSEEEILSYEFEKVIDEKEFTNFDFYIKLKNGKEIFFEIKYTENGFKKDATAKGNEAVRRFNEVYKPLIAKSCNNCFKEVSSKDFMEANYQLYRNAIRATNDSYVVLLTLRENGLTYKDTLKVKGLKHISVLYWEELVVYLNNEMKDTYLNKFANKYFPYISITL